MKSYLKAARYEFIKIRTSRVWLVICLFAFIFQPLLAFATAKSDLLMGLDATPETHPGLIAPLPPIEYMDFETLKFLLMLLAPLGGILGASEYKNHQLRTTFSCLNNHKNAVCAKMSVMILSSVVFSFLAVYVSIAVFHIGLEIEGLHPFFLSTITWKFVLFATINYTLVTILSFGLGIIFKTAIVPIMFIVPQLFFYQLATLDWAKFLPINAGLLLVATPSDPYPHAPLTGGLILGLWAFLTLLVASILYVRRDVGGRY